MIIIHAALLFNSTTVFAGFWTSTELMQMLEEDMRGDATYNVGMVTGYILGVHDSVAGNQICLTDKATVKQVKQVVFNYMKGHPEQWSTSANTIVTKALRSVWPCVTK